MKIPKSVKRYCPNCKKHTEQRVSQNRAKGRSSSHPLSRGAVSRVKRRGERRGAGNLGRYSKPTKPKMSGKKRSKKTDLRYKCTECNRIFMQSHGVRAKRIEFV